MNEALNVIEAETRVRPFHCGTQAADWMASCCHRCTKDFDEESREYRCDLQKAIDEAYFGDGTVSAEVGRRMGHVTGSHAYVWACCEVEWTEEWKAEWRERQTWRWKLRAWVRLAVHGLRRILRRELDKIRMAYADACIAMRPGACDLAFTLWGLGHREWPGHEGAECDGGQTCDCWAEANT